jgi:hypothetical protein
MHVLRRVRGSGCVPGAGGLWREFGIISTSAAFPEGHAHRPPQVDLQPGAGDRHAEVTAISDTCVG